MPPACGPITSPALVCSASCVLSRVLLPGALETLDLDRLRMASGGAGGMDQNDALAGLVAGLSKAPQGGRASDASAAALPQNGSSRAGQLQCATSGTAAVAGTDSSGSSGQVLPRKRVAKNGQAGGLKKGFLG